MAPLPTFLVPRMQAAQKEDRDIPQRFTFLALPAGLCYTTTMSRDSRSYPNALPPQFTLPTPRAGPLYVLNAAAPWSLCARAGRWAYTHVYTGSWALAPKMERPLQV